MKKPRIYAGVTPHDLKTVKPASRPKLSCGDCEATTDKLFSDHRDPPVEEGPCLCADCAVSAIDERISDLESEVVDLESIKRKIKS